MEFLNRYIRQTRIKVATFIFAGVLTPLIIVSLLTLTLKTPPAGLIFFGGLTIALICATVVTYLLLRISIDPIYLLWQNLQYEASDKTTEKPDLTKLITGKELVATIVEYYSKLLSNQDQLQAQKSTNENLLLNILDNSPLPTVAAGPDDKIVYANPAYFKYLDTNPEAILESNIHESLNLSFQTSHTFKEWVDDAKDNKVTDSKTWTRVRLNLGPDKPIKQLDMGAYFNKGNTGGVTTVVALFDNSEKYGNDDQEVSFVALAVHELRTPLTVLRGYIEVFQDELGDQLTPEMKEFMYKMQASAQQLTAFVSNILNVARVEENQLTLNLLESNWKETLESAVKDIELRAKVHNKHLELQIQENLPTVGIDTISIQEVVNNLLDNAIKYSGDSDKIIVKSFLNKEGMVETSVQDFGQGIPSAVMPHLFNKYFRSHTNKQITGTGLGLYLSKALINAHGGNITVNSKEGEGSTFSFTLNPYANIKKDDSQNPEDGIIRGAHGWIKNHSLYRR